MRKSRDFYHTLLYVILNCYLFFVKDVVAHKRATDVSSAEYIYNRYKQTFTSEVGKALLFVICSGLKNLVLLIKWFNYCEVMTVMDSKFVYFRSPIASFRIRKFDCSSHSIFQYSLPWNFATIIQSEINNCLRSTRFYLLFEGASALEVTSPFKFCVHVCDLSSRCAITKELQWLVVVVALRE